MKFSIMHASASIKTGLYHQARSEPEVDSGRRGKLSRILYTTLPSVGGEGERIVKFIYKGNRFYVTLALFADIAFSDFSTSFRCPKTFSCNGIFQSSGQQRGEKFILTVNFNFQGFFSA